MSSPTKAALGMRLYYVEDAGVLFSQATQELHLLNPMATVIWSLLEEGKDESGLIAALQQSYGLEDARSRQFVATALEDWRAKGFLDDSAKLPPPLQVEEAIAPLPNAPPWSAPASHEVRRYRILSSHFIIRFSTKAQADVIRPVLEHLEVNGDQIAIIGTEVDIVTAPDGHLIYRDREPFKMCNGVNELAPIIKSMVWAAVLQDQRFFLNIHAGVVSDGSRCILLPAPPGSGKSTLTAALVHWGFEYFSDEVALLEDRTFNVFPVPLAICVKDSEIEVLADRFPQLRGIAIHDRGDGKRVAYMAPPTQSRPASEEPRPVAALVFPRFAAGEGTSLQPVSKLDALQHLMGECLRVSERLEGHRVDALVQWITRIPCYRLRYDSIEGAIAAVTSVFPAPPHRASHGSPT